MSTAEARPGGTTHVAGTGAYLPATVLGNAEVARLAGVDEEWIVRRTGIRERRVAAHGEGAAAMAAHAARAALASAGVEADGIGVVIVATSTPDHLTPPTACELQAAVGAFGAACFDVEAGFAGWIYALVVADALLRGGLAERALVVGVDKLSTVTDRADPSTGPLFGDGAGAVVLARGAGPLEVRATSWWADGRLADALLRPAGGALRPFDQRVLHEQAHLLRMEGTRLFRASVRTMVAQAERVLALAGITRGHLGLVVPHQANLRILEAVSQVMALPEGLVYVNIGRFGNTGAATVPVALDEARRAGRLVPEKPTLLVSFGAGATAGAVVLGPGGREPD